MKLKKLFLPMFLTLFLSACQTVTTKIDETTEQEKKELNNCEKILDLIDGVYTNSIPLTSLGCFLNSEL